MKKTLWIRELSCGHERPTNLAFMCKNYDKPKVNDNCYCRECSRDVKIIGVEKAKDSDMKELEEILKEMK